MAQIVVRGENVYQCTVCSRKIRVPNNRYGLDVVHYCTITQGCKGKLNRVTIPKEVNNTPAIPPEVTGIQDWFQRQMLYTYTQTIASNTWTIQHNLGTIPIIHTFLNQIVNGVMTLVETLPPPYKIIDDNNIILTFPEAVSGVAQLEALSSRNTANLQKSKVVQNVNNIQVTTNTGVLTIATLDPSPITEVTLTYVVPGQNPIAIVYNNLASPPDANSPWSGINQVYVGGVVYTVRSFNLVSHPAALQYFISGQIPSTGCAVYVGTPLNGPTGILKSVLILEAKSPYASVDIITNQYVDFSAETKTSANILYSYGVAVVTPNTPKSIYPYISVV